MDISPCLNMFIVFCAHLEFNSISIFYLFWNNLNSNMWCVQVLRSPKKAFAAAMQSWRERCEKCVCLQGDYVEK